MADGRTKMSTRATTPTSPPHAARAGRAVSALRQEVAAVAGDLRVLRDRCRRTTHHRAGRGRSPSRSGRFEARLGRCHGQAVLGQDDAELRRGDPQGGPMTAAQLHATLDADVLEMAESRPRADRRLADRGEAQRTRAAGPLRPEDGGRPLRRTMTGFAGQGPTRLCEGLRTVRFPAEGFAFPALAPLAGGLGVLAGAIREASGRPLCRRLPGGRAEGGPGPPLTAPADTLGDVVESLVRRPPRTDGPTIPWKDLEFRSPGRLPVACRSTTTTTRIRSRARRPIARAVPNWHNGCGCTRGSSSPRRRAPRGACSRFPCSACPRRPCHRRTRSRPRPVSAPPVDLELLLVGALAWL